jgi:hypothetical protein
MTAADSAVLPPGAVSPEEGVRADLRRLLRERLIRESGIVLFGHPLMMGLVVYATWDGVPHFVAAGWALAVLLATGFRSVWLRTVHQRALTDQDIWLGVRLTVTLLGLCWGVGWQSSSGSAVLPRGTAAGGARAMIAAADNAVRRFSQLSGVRRVDPGPVSWGSDRRVRPAYIATAAGTALLGLMAFIFRRAPAKDRRSLRATALLAVSEGPRGAQIAMRQARDAAATSARAAAPSSRT